MERGPIQLAVKMGGHPFDGRSLVLLDPDSARRLGHK